MLIATPMPLFGGEPGPAPVRPLTSGSCDGSIAWLRGTHTGASRREAIRGPEFRLATEKAAQHNQALIDWFCEGRAGLCTHWFAASRLMIETLLSDDDWRCPLRIAVLFRTAFIVALALALGASAEAALSGRVTTADGTALPGAKIEAFPYEDALAVGERRVAGKALTPLEVATSAADGTFRLEAKGVSWVQAVADGHAPSAARVEDSAPLHLTLLRAATRPGVLRAGGRPVAGAVVVWSTSEGGELLLRSDASGVFEVPDPASAPGQLWIFHPDFAPDTAYVGSAHEGTGLDQELDVGEPVVGRAVDGAGRPIANGRVWLDGAWPLGRTDAKGAFTIAHAPRSWTNVSVRAPGAVGALSRKRGPLLLTVRPERTLAGLVTDAATRLPLSGATVVVETTAGTLSAESDARGRYSLAGVPAGRVRPYAGRTGYASGPKNYEKAPIDLRTASAGRFDVALEPLPRVEGRVVDERNQPVGGAQVSLGMKDSPNIYASAAWLGLWSDDDGGSVVTGPDGSFALTLSDDEVEGPSALVLADRPLIVLKRGFAAAQAPADPKGAKGPLVVPLARGLALQGRVMGPDGAPASGVAVTAAEDGAVGGSFVPTLVVLQNAKGDGWATTDEQGRFDLRVHPAVHHLHFRKPGYAPQLVRGHDPRSGQPLQVTLEPAAFVRGRLSQADGRGVAGAHVRVASPSGSAGGNAVTGADGTFEVRDLAPGDYSVLLAHEPLGIRQTRTVQAPVTDLQIVLAPAVTLRGTVLDATTRQPLPRFDLAVRSENEDAQAWRQVEGADAAGSFVLEDLPVGEATVTVSAEGYIQRRIEDIELEAGLEPPPIEVLMETDAPIRGRITGPTGEGIAEAQVRTDQKGGPRVSVNEEGEYEVGGLAPGEVKLTFTADGFVSEQRTLDSRQAARLDVTLKRGLTLAGVVVRDGVGVADVSVSAQSSVARAANQSAQTDERGRFSLSGLVPGRYTVTANATNGSAKLEDVDAQTSGPLRLVLDKSGTAVLTGRVVGLPEGDIGMSMITARNEESGESGHAAFDASRTFRMAEAPAGRVQVQAFVNSLTEGSTRSSRPLSLVLAPGSETETVIEFADDATVTGVVTLEGSPVPMVMVSFMRDDGPSVMARTDGRGVYQATGLELGHHKVHVWGERVSYATEYVVSASGEFDIDVTGGALSGRVVQADGGAPIEGVVVSLFRQGGNENRAEGGVTTGRQGAFVQRSLRDGRYRLVTSKAGFGQQVRDVDVASGATAEVVIELTPADGVSVAVVDARDSRPLDAIVVVRDQARRIVANRHSGTEEDGTVNIPLADGSYLLSTSANGYGTVTRPVTAPSRGLRIGLTPGGTLLIESARELRGRVRLLQPDGEEYVRCWCNGIADIQLKGRRTTVENITPGAYTLEIVDAPSGTAPRPVVVNEGQTSKVTIE